MTLLTASGRPDQSHRLAPVSVTPYTCHHNQREGWEGKGKTTHSRKGAWPHVSLGRHVWGTSPIFTIPPRACGRNNSIRQNALHIFSQARIKILAPWKYVPLLLPGWMEWPRHALGNARFWRCWQRAVGPTRVTD